MIKTWIVICDCCKREINAIKETFYDYGEDTQIAYQHLCKECYEKEG